MYLVEGKYFQHTKKTSYAMLGLALYKRGFADV